MTVKTNTHQLKKSLIIDYFAPRTFFNKDLDLLFFFNLQVCPWIIFFWISFLLSLISLLSISLIFILKELETSSSYRKYTIEHIADLAGFTSSNAFYRAFKKFTGLTPSYYIKKRMKQD